MMSRSLVPWKVSIPVNDGFKENVSRVELKHEDESSPVDTLSDVFSEVPARKHLAVVSFPPLHLTPHPAAPVVLPAVILPAALPALPAPQAGLHPPHPPSLLHTARSSEYISHRHYPLHPFHLYHHCRH